MALPVSIGDVIMLSKLAYQLGQAFTTGRKSAPAEFEDVRNLLYSLSTALELIVRDLPEVASSNISTCDNVSKKEQEDNILVHIVSNCKRTLTYLEATVAKYSILEDDPNQPKKTRMKSWSEDIRKNWKKIVWTKEGGDLVKLKATLVAHMNSLTLAISAATRWVTFYNKLTLSAFPTSSTPLGCLQSYKGQSGGRNNCLVKLEVKLTRSQASRRSLTRTNRYHPYQIGRHTSMVHGKSSSRRVRHSSKNSSRTTAFISTAIARKAASIDIFNLRGNNAKSHSKTYLPKYFVFRPVAFEPRKQYHPEYLSVSLPLEYLLPD
jgi:hypothetical protein